MMSPWLVNVDMDGVNRVMREMNPRVLWQGLELQSAKGSRFEINHVIFADNTAIVYPVTNLYNSEEKLYRLVTGFGTVCKR